MLRTPTVFAFALRLAIFLACCPIPIAGANAAGTIVVNEQAYYPEQPLWYRGALFYAEMSKDRVMKWDGARNSVFWTEPGCGPTSVAKGGGETFVFLCHLRNSLVEVDTSGHKVGEYNRDVDGKGFVTPNGSTNDAKGGIYFSSSGIFAGGAPATGSVYYLGANRKIKKVADKIWYSNGVALSHDGNSLFVSEHLGRRILVYPVNADASLGEKKVFLSLDDIASVPDSGEWWVGPDGLAMDSNDNLYIAEYGAGRLLIVDKAGLLKKKIFVPEKFITAPRFGETEETLFITAPGNNTTPPFIGKVYSMPNPLFAAPGK